MRRAVHLSDLVQRFYDPCQCGEVRPERLLAYRYEDISKAAHDIK
ncbi:hypothetical protein P3T23_009223 [Paraburkholderia sp. GAS448]